MGLKQELLSGDRLRAIDALLEQVADKLDAGICSHCGGPRGEASGMASLTLKAMNLLDMRKALLPEREEGTTRDDLAKQRNERRRRARAQNPVETVRDRDEFGSGGS